MKYLLLMVSTLCALLVAACGGGGSSVKPPPPTGGFSNASLKGQYAFAMSGEDLNGGYISRAGSFVADGNGAITSALEDLVDGTSGAGLVSFTGGTYSIQSNGRGLLVLNAGNNSGLQLNIILTSSSQGFMVQTDLNAASTGNFSLQTTSAFNNAALSGNYVFDFDGVAFTQTNAAPISTIGQIKLDGNGNVTAGTVDINNGNNGGNAPSGATAITPGTYAIDPVNGSPFGRGTMTFDGNSYAYYIVDSTHVKFIEEDTNADSIGDGVIQSGTIPTTTAELTGGFVFLVGGASVLGSQGAVASAGRFTADGNGGVAAIALDDNDGGTIVHVSQGPNISNAKYAIDANNAGTGRGTFQFTNSGSGTYSYVFYMISPTQAVIQAISPGIIADGTMLAQSGSPFTNSNLTGNFGFNWSGIQLGSNNAIPFEEDFVGQFIFSNTSISNISGVYDYTELGLSGKNLYNDVALSGTLTLNGDGTLDNKIQVINGLSPSTTYNFKMYIANPNTMLMVVVDSTRVTAGIVSIQSP